LASIQSDKFGSGVDSLSAAACGAVVQQFVYPRNSLFLIRLSA